MSMYIYLLAFLVYIHYKCIACEHVHVHVHVHVHIFASISCLLVHLLVHVGYYGNQSY